MKKTAISIFLAMLCAGLVVAQTGAEAAGDAVPETAAERDARMAWWREAKFGMFIHWGVYAVPAGIYKGKRIGGLGEWIMRNGKIPVAEYKAFARDFNPVKYDADAWVELAEQTGMKYIVITAKHHDGFSLYDSAVTDWDIAGATPYKQDLLGPLVDAAKKRGLKIGFYYSQAQDWTHPGGAKMGRKEGSGWDEAHKGDFDAYLKAIAYPQTKELLSNYEIDVLWWDTPTWMTKERAALLDPLIRLRPGLITNNRLGGGYKGDTDTPEQRIPATGIPGRDWETCMTMNGTWGYKSYDHKWKSTETLVRNLVDIVSKGGNYLLNIGPKADGTIPQESIDRLEQVGEWMQVNGEAIYGTTASPCEKPAWGRVTTKRTAAGTTLYLHVFDWPADGELHLPLSNQPVSSYLLADRPREFRATQGDRGISVKLVGDPPDLISSTVVLEIQGEPEAVVYVIRQQEDGTVVLSPEEADLHGALRTEQKGGRSNIGYWTQEKDWVGWTFNVTQPGGFELSAELGGVGESRFTVEAGEQRLTVSTEGSGSYDSFKSASLGRLTLEAGKHRLKIVPVADEWHPLNLRALTLRPIKAAEPVTEVETWLDPGDKAMNAWRDMRFGMFVHWGPVSLTGHEIGWSRGRQTPVEEYDNLYKRFNPVKFDADAWVATAKEAGMKYLVITTKHHDGFCLWPSEATDYDIGETPFKRDVLAELSAACRRQGIRFGTYYSVCDWYHPAFPRGSPGGRTRKPNPDLAAYDRYLRAQTKELVTNYGPLVTMWFDVPQVYGRDYGVPMVKTLRSLQPDIVINNRAYKGAPGDYTTPEQKIGGFNRDRPWETCMTICRQWAWKPNDKMKSLKQCLQTLIRTVGGDGNLLFNVGPMPDGRIEPRQVERLKEMGDWLDRYGQTIYGTRGGPFKPGKWGAATCKGRSIHLFVMEWNGDSLSLPPLDAEVKEAGILTGGDVSMTQDEQGINLTVAREHQDPIATVIELKIEGDAVAIEPLNVTCRSRSLAFGKQATASNVYQNQHAMHGPQKALDDDPETRWATDTGTLGAQLTVDLGRPVRIGRVLIDERQWDRIRKFKLQAKVDDDWQTLLEGTTVGQAFTRTFAPVVAQHVRLNITEATDGPTISEFQLFGPAE